MFTTQQSLERLFSRRAWHKNSGINASTARVYKKRFYENRLELKTQLKILEACGFTCIQPIRWKDSMERDQLRTNLIEKLKKEHAFWSFDPTTVSGISDEYLIEKTLMHLDLDDIQSLFTLFPFSRIKALWKEKLLVQEPFFHNLNSLFAFMFFNIKNPDRYIRNFINNKQKSIQCRD